MLLSKNFKLEEFTASSTATKNYISNYPGDAELANLQALCEKILQPIRNFYQKPIKITSGYRCPELNKAVGGSPTSQHLRGEAADIVCENNRGLWNLICQMVRQGEITVGQLINEKNLSWIHISVPGKHRNQIL